MNSVVVVCGLVLVGVGIVVLLDYLVEDDLCVGWLVVLFVSL